MTFTNPKIRRFLKSREFHNAEGVKKFLSLSFICIVEKNKSVPKCTLCLASRNILLYNLKSRNRLVQVIVEFQEHIETTCLEDGFGVVRNICQFQIGGFISTFADALGDLALA